MGCCVRIKMKWVHRPMSQIIATCGKERRLCHRIEGHRGVSEETNRATVRGVDWTEKGPYDHGNFLFCDKSWDWWISGSPKHHGIKCIHGVYYIR